jgi:hypothetical protein
MLPRKFRRVNISHLIRPVPDARQVLPITGSRVTSWVSTLDNCARFHGTYGPHFTNEPDKRKILGTCAREKIFDISTIAILTEGVPCNKRMGCVLQYEFG